MIVIVQKELMSARREVVWASFQASLASPEENKRESTEAKMVKVQKRYLFAGEYTTCASSFLALKDKI